MPPGWIRGGRALAAACIFAACLPAQSVDVGSGSPTPAIQMAFVNAWSRGGFNQLVGPPTGNVTSYGATGLIQQFPSITTSKVTYALTKPDTTSTYNVVQMQPAMFLSLIHI